jgi:hypothetical protein
MGTVWKPVPPKNLIFLFFLKTQVNLMVAHKREAGNQKHSPGGTGFQPVKSFQVTRRNLPHWQETGRVYFITWRCKDGVVLMVKLY